MKKSIEQLEWEKHLVTPFMWYMVQYAFLPAKLMEARASLEYRQFREVAGGDLDPMVKSFHMHFWAMHREMLGRAVQPLGPLKELSSIVGAVRLKGGSAVNASTTLSEIVFDAFERNDEPLIKQIRKLFAVPLGDHKNYQIWVAIFEVIQSGNYAPSREMRLKGFNLCFIPNTNEIRSHVKCQRKLGRRQDFSGLPSDENDEGWRDLRKAPGYRGLVEKGVRGKAKVQHGPRKKPDV